MKNDVLDIFTNFTKLSGHTVGFDIIIKRLVSLNQMAIESAVKYPPYNIKRVDENRYVIELAVAGFSKQDIDIEMKDGTLTIRGKHETLDDLTKDGTSQEYLYRGIASRPFALPIPLAQDIEVKNADLFNGMLKIWLEHLTPDHKKPKKIDINDAGDLTSKK